MALTVQVAARLRPEHPKANKVQVEGWAAQYSCTVLDTMAQYNILINLKMYLMVCFRETQYKPGGQIIPPPLDLKT